MALRQATTLNRLLVLIVLLCITTLSIKFLTKTFNRTYFFITILSN